MIKTTKSKSKSIDKLKKVHDKTQGYLQKAIEPLNARLRQHDMHVYWDGEEYMVNQYSASERGGLSFWLNDSKLKVLMDMSDKELIEYVTRWPSPH